MGSSCPMLELVPRKEKGQPRQLKARNVHTCMLNTALNKEHLRARRDVLGAERMREQGMTMAD